MLGKQFFCRDTARCRNDEEYGQKCCTDVTVCYSICIILCQKQIPRVFIQQINRTGRGKTMFDHCRRTVAGPQRVQGRSQGPRGVGELFRMQCVFSKVTGGELYVIYVCTYPRALLLYYAPIYIYIHVYVVIYVFYS